MTLDFSALGRQLKDLLGLRLEPVALAFRESAPPDVQRIDAPAPSGCTYWKQAAEGKTFYTEAADHYNCPIGAHTHGIDLPSAQAGELEGLVGTMVSLEYIRHQEVETIPRLHAPFQVAVYAPLAEAPCEPDVVLVRGNAKQMMLLAEAARAAGVGHQGEMMGRPTCAMIPQTMQAGHSTVSLGCIGNRVYTGLADDELYFAAPGGDIGAVVDKLMAIVRANRELETYHRARCHPA